MKKFGSTALVAFGIATLCLLAILGPLLTPSHTIIYHTSSSALPLFAAVLFDLFAFATLLTAALLLAEKPGRLQFVIWSAILLALPLVLLKNVSMLVGFILPRPLIQAILALSFAAFLVLQIFWRPSFIPWFQRLRRFLRVVLSFVALSGVFMVGQLLWYAWQVRALNPPVVLHQRTASVAKPRVIWIVLDELSYQQVYEQRYPGLQLPAFDQLAQESTVFTHVVPAGLYTEDVIPSLMTGHVANGIRVSPDGQHLSLQYAADGRWHLFDAHQTVFEDALNSGYSTAVAGWFNPYCRLLPQVLDRCYWISQLLYPGGIDSNLSLADNMLQQITHVTRTMHSLLAGHAPPLYEPAQKLHLADYQALRNAADALLSDPDASFLFLHMPIPHPLGIYNRHKKALTLGSASYIDNLALADDYLAHVREQLIRQKEWDSSTIVIMGDHSWRTSMIWSKLRGWTPEDRAASHNAQFDDRPAYIVKLPSQQHGARIDASFKAIHTRALLDALLAGQLHTPDELNAWVKAQK